MPEWLLWYIGTGFAWASLKDNSHEFSTLPDPASIRAVAVLVLTIAWPLFIVAAAYRIIRNK